MRFPAFLIGDTTLWGKQHLAPTKTPSLCYRYTVVEPRFAKTGFHSVQKARGDTELTQGQGQVDTLEKAEKSDFCLLYLEDHPSGCKWLGSPPFVSHLAHLEGK